MSTRIDATAMLQHSIDDTLGQITDILRTARDENWPPEKIQETLKPYRSLLDDYLLEIYRTEQMYNLQDFFDYIRKINNVHLHISRYINGDIFDKPLPPIVMADELDEQHAEAREEEKAEKGDAKQDATDTVQRFLTQQMQDDKSDDLGNAELRY